MGQIQPKEEAHDAPDSLVRRMPAEVHGARRHVDMQVNSLTRLDVTRRREIERKEEVEKKRQKLLLKGQGQIFGLLDDDWTFPGPVLAPAINELISPPDEEELERRKEAAEKAKEEKFVRENELAMKKEQQGSIARRLKALSKPQQKHKPEAEEEYEEDEPVTDQGDTGAEEEAGGEEEEEEEEEEVEEEEAIPQRPPVPKDDDTPGFVGIVFMDPTAATDPTSANSGGAPAAAGEAEEDLPPVPTRKSRR